MICYKDRWFCQFYLVCKEGHGCERAATPEVLKQAREAGLYIDYRLTFPECFVAWFEQDKKE